MTAIVDTPGAFLRALDVLATPMRRAVPRSVFMVMPEQFSVASESASDNAYMTLDSSVDPDRALAQATALADLVESVGVRVHRFPGRADQTDGVFPNNVFGTADGRFIVGAMRHPGRQAEAGREDIRRHFTQHLGFELVDLSGTGCVAELTGPLIIDRARRLGFCGMTQRVNDAGAEAMHEAFGLELTFRFNLVPEEYHTNVVMSVLAGRACVLVPEAFGDAAVPDAIGVAYPGRTLRLSEAEKLAFAGNCIALTESDLFMSQAGAEALEPGHRTALEDWGFRIHSTPLDEIEKAGGSLRCMIGEVF